MPALAPKSALAYRPVHPDVAIEEPPRIARASRTKGIPRQPDASELGTQGSTKGIGATTV